MMNASDKFLEIINYIENNIKPSAVNNSVFSNIFVFENYTLIKNIHGEVFLNENFEELGNINIDGTNSLQNEFDDDVKKMNQSYNKFKSLSLNYNNEC